MSARAFAPPRPKSRSAWRGLALLTIAIALAHLLALGLVPAGLNDTATPLGGKFSTRTIVLAPLAAPDMPALSPPAPATPKLAQAAPKPRPKPKPKPKPTLPPEPRTAPSPESVTPQAQAPTPPEPLPDAASTPDASAEATAAPASAALDASGNAGVSLGSTGTASTGAGTAAPGAGAAPATGPNENIGSGTRAMKIPGSMRLGFSVSGQQGATPYQGGYGELAWLHNGADYDAQLTLKLLFLTFLNQRSTGLIGNDGLAPDRFADKRRNRPEQAAHFVRDQGQIVFSNNKPGVQLQPGAQDRLSVMMQLGALLAGDAARYQPGSTITVQTVGTGDGDIWTFNVEGDETLDLPAGTYQTRKLSRNPRREFDDKVELWLAPNLGYLPVRLRFTQAKGDFFDIQLRSANAAEPN